MLYREALDLYLFALQQLAYPASLASLFPEDPEAASTSTKLVAVQDALRAVFRWAADISLFFLAVRDTKLCEARDPDPPLFAVTC